MDYQTRELSIGGTIKGSFKTLGEHLGFYFVTGVIFFIVVCIYYGVSAGIFTIATDNAFDDVVDFNLSGLEAAIYISILAAISIIVETIFSAAWINCSLLYMKGRRIRFSEFSIFRKRVLKASISAIVVPLALAVFFAPFILLFIEIDLLIALYIISALYILFSIYVITKFGFAMPAMMENSKMGIVEALRYSAKITYNFTTRFQVVAISAVILTLLVILSYFTFIIGAVFVFSLSPIAHAYIYLALKDRQTQNQ